jgi:Icc-related predicted phosphoesterase
VKTSLRILALTDFHGSLETSKRTVEKAQNINADIILICGDITHYGSVKEAEEILEPLIALNPPVLYVSGNCDPAQLAEAEINGAINVHGRCHTVNDVSFIGIGGAPASPFYSWFELSETKIRNTLDQAADLCSTSRWVVIVSHAPPKDTVVDLAFSKTHAGSVGLRAFIEERKPNIVFCGHIHEAKGVDHIGNTVIVNPGPVRHGYCAVTELDDKIEVKLDSI